MCATTMGGADRPAADADEHKAGIPVSSKYGIGHTHAIAPSAIVQLIEMRSFLMLK
jgi:hypothetical protein